MSVKNPRAPRKEGHRHEVAPHRKAGPKMSETSPDNDTTLKPHERRLLRWMAHGHDAAAIAQRLQRDEETVTAHAAELLARLGVDSAQAALDKLGLTREPDASDDAEAEPVADGSESSGASRA